MGKIIVSKAIKILKELEKEPYNIKVSRGFNKNSIPTYIVVYHIFTSSVYESNDLNGANLSTIRVGVFSKSDYIALIEKIKSLLETGGFFNAETQAEIYEEDTGYWHVAIDFDFITFLN